MTTHNRYYSLTAKLIHLGLAGFGIGAYITSEFAEGGTETYGYLVHAYLGLSVAAIILLRIGAGAGKSPSLSFRYWSLFSGAQWRMIVEDLRGLGSLKIPDRGRHEGIAGLVQALGLLLFGWMASTGTALYLFRADIESILYETIEEAHEMGEGLIPLYLLLHVGAVFLHTIFKQPVWYRMFRFRTGN